MTSTLSPLRMDRITGSRLPAILGLSPYTTRKAVMREMVRQHFGDVDEWVDNPITRWGNEHEADALAAYAKDQQVALYGMQEFVVHPVYDFLGVSLDARAEGRVVEVKCPWSQQVTYRHINDRLDYQEQLALQIACTGADFGHFAVWRLNEPIAISTLMPEPQWLEDRLPKLDQFMHDYHEIIGSPELAEPFRSPLVDQRWDAEWQVAAFEFCEAAAHLSKAELSASQARNNLIKLAGDKSARGFGVIVTRSERRGNVDWPALVKKHAPDAALEDFRKPPSVVFTVRQSAANPNEEL